MNKEVIVITGPTASGKTKLAHSMALSLDGQVIMADSMKVYREADIGTSTPPLEYREEVNYHLVNIIEPTERYNLGKFYRDSRDIIDRLHKDGKLPVVCGGTSLYITKLMEGLAEIPSLEEDIKEELNNRESGDLYEELQKKDPARAKNLHPNMKKRIVRALGIYRQTGKKMSTLLQKTTPPDYEFIPMAIKWDRDILYERINKRVDRMIDSGFIDEVKTLSEKYSKEAPVFEGVGYRDILKYLEGDIKLKKAKDDIKQSTRNYAR
ncbi:MAG: tRNA (adenosine(37)-N6)-dimethylallyltransferase MiaA, partial [Elusimicrobiota bacterium]